MPPKKNEIYPLRIENYGSSGEGVARLDGQAVFVKGAIPGELCAVQLLKVGKTAAWGRVAEVLEPSPARQVPDCPLYPRCGGCQLRHMTYEEELRFKRQKVEDALRRIGGWGGAVGGVLSLLPLEPQLLFIGHVPQLTAAALGIEGTVRDLPGRGRLQNVSNPAPGGGLPHL